MCWLWEHGESVSATTPMRRGCHGQKHCMDSRSSTSRYHCQCCTTLRKKFLLLASNPELPKLQFRARVIHCIIWCYQEALSSISFAIALLSSVRCCWIPLSLLFARLYKPSSLSLPSWAGCSRSFITLADCTTWTWSSPPNKLSTPRYLPKWWQTPHFTATLP